MLGNVGLKMTDKLNKYKKLILNSSKESEIEDISNNFSDDLLDYGMQFPDSYLDFLIEIMSTKKYYDKAGLYNFLAVVSIEVDIMSHPQLERLVKVISNNYFYYIDEMLCITSIDFIARYLSSENATIIINDLYLMENDSFKKQICLDGIKIIDNEKKRIIK